MKHKAKNFLKKATEKPWSDIRDIRKNHCIMRTPRFFKNPTSKYFKSRKGMKTNIW